MQKVFLSYGHEDVGMAKKLYKDLTMHNLDVWFDIESLSGGQKWKTAINKAIKESNFFLLLLSSNTVDKVGFIQKEMKIALDVLDHYPDSGIFLIPVRLDICEINNDKLIDLQWIDLFPENNYEMGLNKILKVISPGTFHLRSEPKELKQSEVVEMIRKHGFLDRDTNPEGRGFNHDFLLQNIKGDSVVYDRNAGLMWQKGGSDQTYFKFDDAYNWVEALNRVGFAGFSDWRLPTLEEAMSLVSSKEDMPFIDAIFDRKQWEIWSSDLVKGPTWGNVSGAGNSPNSSRPRNAWIVHFGLGSCDGNGVTTCYVRAVRTVK